MKLYKIYIADENGEHTIEVKPTNQDKKEGFDCVFAAEEYAKAIGLKEGYEVR